MIEQFKWLNEAEYWHFESLTEDIDYYIEAGIDENGEMVDIIYTQGSYRTSFEDEPTFWVWEDLMNGNYVAEIA